MEPQPQPSMKKIFYYNFMPSSKEEHELQTTNGRYHTTRTVIEIRDFNLKPRDYGPYTNPVIRKTLEANEIATGKIHLSHEDVFEKIFSLKEWSVRKANEIVNGVKERVTVYDLTDSDTSPTVYEDRDTYFEKGFKDEYVLGLNMAIFRSREFKKGDGIALSVAVKARDKRDAVSFDATNGDNDMVIFYFKGFVSS